MVDWCLVAWHGSTWLVGPVEWEKLGDDGLRGPALWQLLSRKRKGNGFDFLATRNREIVHKIKHTNSFLFFSASNMMDIDEMEARCEPTHLVFFVPLPLLFVSAFSDGWVVWRVVKLPVELSKKYCRWDGF